MQPITKQFLPLFFSAFFFFLGNSENSEARRQYGFAGCGFGSLLVGPDGPQLIAATSNGTSSDATFSSGFGITSGTSNCLTDEEYASLQIQEQFVLDNYQTLAKQMAQGRGETLVAFSVTLGCSNESFPEFSKVLQSNYTDIVASPGALALLETIRLKISSEAILQQTCQKLLIE